MEDAFMTRFILITALATSGTVYVVFTLAADVLASVPV